jgi:hypothetical protein
MGRYPPPPLPVRKFTDPGHPHGIGVNESTPDPDIESAQKLGLEDVRKEGRAVSKRLHEQSGLTDLEEIQRNSRENWRTEYGGEKT